MAWKQALSGFLKSTPMMSMIGGVIATGCYVVYKDYSRYNQMIDTYKTGNILAPMAENQFELLYQSRPNEEACLRRILSGDFTNEYYLINGEVGVGKTRTIVEIVRDMMKISGGKKMGAPVYVLVTQGKSLPETLAEAVQFQFDEHISYSFFLDYILRIESFPRRDNDSKLTRVLNAIEESSFQYMLRTGNPVVLIIDGLNQLGQHMPGALEKIQDKAKLWADTNTVKVVFVNNDEETEELLQRNSSSWSRAATPLLFDDFSREDAIKFLLMEQVWETLIEGTNTTNLCMSRKQAEQIVDLVGGRIIHLLSFKKDFTLGIPLDVTMEHVKDREREKFIHISRSPKCWDVVAALRKAPNKSMKLSKIIKLTSQENVNTLVKHNVIRYIRDDIGILVKFQSVLTDNVVDELEQVYVQEKEAAKREALLKKG